MMRFGLLIMGFTLGSSLWADQGALPAKPLLPHPRLAHTADELKTLRRDAARVAAARREAERFLSGTRTRSWKDYFVALPEAGNPPRHEGFNWPYWTPLTAELRMELEALSFGHAMTGDTRYLARAKTLLLSLAAWDRWTDPDACSLGHDPCLDTYLLTAGAAVAYDYLYDHLSPAERARIRAAIVNKGLRLIASRANDPKSYVQHPSKWPNAYAMVHAAAGLGALAVWGEEPDAPALLKSAIEKSRMFLDEEGKPDGALIEGFYYGAASMEPLSLFFSALVRGAGVNLFAHPYFRHAHEFPMYFLIPGTNWLAGFGDSGGPHGEQPIFLGTLNELARFGKADPRAVWYLQQGVALPETEPAYLATIQKGVFYAVRHTSPGRDVWPGEVAAMRSAPPEPGPASKHFASIGWVAMRTGWDPRSALLAFRSGPNVGHSHLDQNSFILASRGEVLASDPGYQRFNLKYPDQPDYERTKREHAFTHGAIGHNVILVDGEGQTKAPGRVLGFLDNPAFTWTAGDAAAAYPALRKFTRHVLHMKRAGYFVVVDEIETGGQLRHIDWLLQTQPRGAFEVRGGTLRIASGAAALTVTLPLNANAAWTAKSYPDSGSFGRTMAAGFEGSRLRIAAVLEPHDAAAQPRYRFKATEAGAIEGAGDRILFTEDAAQGVELPGTKLRLLITQGAS